MFCKLCEANGKHNLFTEGCSNFRKSAILDHSVAKDHRLCSKASEHRENNIQLKKRVQSDEEKAASVAVRAAHWIVTENLPVSKFRSQMDLLKTLESPYMKRTIKTPQDLSEWVVKVVEQWAASRNRLLFNK